MLTMDAFLGLMIIVGHVANIAGALGAVIAAVGVIRMRREQKRSFQYVPIVLELITKNRSYELPLEMLRKDISRAELLGRLGMVQCVQHTRFSLDYLSTRTFMHAINDIVAGRASRLVIPCTEPEYQQFVR